MAKFFNLSEAAEALGITPESLQSWIAEGRASATRRSGQWMLREFEVRKLKKSLPVARPPAAPEGRSPEPRSSEAPDKLVEGSGGPVAVAAAGDPGPAAKASVSRSAQGPAAKDAPDPKDPKTAGISASPVTEGPPEGALSTGSAPLRPPPPPGQGFHERRRSPGRRRDDLLRDDQGPASHLLESISQGLEPLVEAQARIMECLQRGEAQQILAVEGAVSTLLAGLEKARAAELADLRALVESQGALLAQAVAAEASTLRALQAGSRDQPAQDLEVARSLEDLRREVEGLRQELGRCAAAPASAPDASEVARLREERDRTLRERDLLRTERERLVDELAEARSDTQDLTRARDEVSGERDLLRAEQERLVNELSRARSEAKDVARARDEVCNERDRLASERDRLQSLLERVTREGAAKGADRQRLESDLEDLRRQRAALQAERDQALAELVNLRSERERLAPEPIVHESRTELTDLTRRLEALRKPSEAAGLRPEDLAEGATRALEESRGQCQQLEARLRTADAEIKHLQDRLRDLMERTQPLTGDLHSAHQELDEVRSERDALQGALEQERRQRAEEVERRVRESRDLEKSLLKVEGERTRLLQKQTALDAEMAALRAALKAGEGTREEDARFAPDGMARLQGRINGLQRELDAAQRQLVDAREAQNRVASEREAAAERIRDLQEQLKALNYKLSVGGTPRGSADSRDLEAEVVRLEAETAEKDSLIQDGHRERAEMRMELEKAQRAFYELQQRVERERKEWSEILAREIKQREDAQRPAPASEEEPARRASAWRLFRSRGGG